MPRVICEAATLPTMRFVPIKSPDQQAALALHRARDLLVRRIIDDELWQAVKARQGAIRGSEGVTKARASRFWERRRVQHLLTGLAWCGCCGGRLASIGRDYLACSWRPGPGDPHQHREHPPARSSRS